MARISLTLLAIDPEYTLVYAAAPYKNVADYTIWGELETCFLEIKEHHPEVYPMMRRVPSFNKCYFTEKYPKTGRAELIGLDQAARLQGAKSFNPNRGFLVVLADEIGVFPSHAFMEILANISANKNFIGFTGCNFKSTLGMEGPLCNPKGREYTDLDLEDDIFWESDFNTVTLRLDGHQCPNIIEDREIFPYLLLPKKRAQMEESHGLRGPKYMEQIRSFPNMAAGDSFVLSKQQLRAGSSFDEFWQPEGKPVTVAFCDPGWRGDPCKIGAFKFCPCSAQAHDGSKQKLMIFWPVEPIQTIRLEVGRLADIDFIERLRSATDQPVMIRPNQEITMDMQIAVGCAEYLKRHGIAREHFGFDASCRGSITQEMISVLGLAVKVYDFGASATEMVADPKGNTAKDLYYNLRSEMFFGVQTLVLSGQLRKANLIMDALTQICRHRIETKGKKRAAESKDEYKKCNQGKSPDAADVLVGALHVARKEGLQFNFSRRRPDPESLTLGMWGQSRNFGRSRRRAARLG